jgi:hypothetical protein
VNTSLTVPASIPAPIGEVLAPESYPIAQYDTELRAAARNYRYSLAKIAYYGFRLRLTDGWTSLGFEPGPRGEEAYRESLDIPRSTWYKAVRIGQALHQLSLEDLSRIPTTNADLLTQVDPAIIHDHAWVSEAKSLPPKEMADLVATRNRTVGGKEPLSTLIFRVPFLAKRAIEDMLEAIQHKYELSSKGQTLELMIADLHNDANLIAATDKAQRLLAGIAESMKRRQAPEDEQAWLRLAREVLNEGHEKAVSAAREKQARSQKNGGRA